MIALRVLATDGCGVVGRGLAEELGEVVFVVGDRFGVSLNYPEEQTEEYDEEAADLEEGVYVFS